MRKHISILFLFLCTYTYVINAEMTQTEAHLSIPSIRALVEKKYNFKQNPFYKKIYDQVITKEKLYNNTHYFFYNGFTNEWRLPQDLYLKLYAKLHPLTADIKDFRAFRWITVDHKTPVQFLKEEITKNGMVDDNKLHIKSYLLSTNLALFGNVGYAGECTFEFFLNAKSHRSINEQIFKDILDIFDKPSSYAKGEIPILYKYIPEIEKLVAYLQPDKLPNGLTPQSLSQIAIPKNITDQVAYVSWVRGMPFDNELVSWLKDDKDLNTKPPSFKQFQPKYNEIQALFKNKPTNNPLFNEILKGIQNGKYAISTLLNKYKTNPGQIPGLNYLQARLIISPEYIGNISAGVKVFTYDNISEKNKTLYEEILDDIVNRIRKDILSRAVKKR